MLTHHMHEGTDIPSAFITALEQDQCPAPNASAALAITTGSQPAGNMQWPCAVASAAVLSSTDQSYINLQGVARGATGQPFAVSSKHQHAATHVEHGNEKPKDARAGAAAAPPAAAAMALPLACGAAVHGQQDLQSLLAVLQQVTIEAVSAKAQAAAAAATAAAAAERAGAAAATAAEWCSVVMARLNASGQTSPSNLQPQQAKFLQLRQSESDAPILCTPAFPAGLSASKSVSVHSKGHSSDTPADEQLLNRLRAASAGGNIPSHGQAAQHVVFQKPQQHNSTMPATYTMRTNSPTSELRVAAKQQQQVLLHQQQQQPVVPSVGPTALGSFDLLDLTGVSVKPGNALEQQLAEMVEELCDAVLHGTDQSQLPSRGGALAGIPTAAPAPASAPAAAAAPAPVDIWATAAAAPPAGRQHLAMPGSEQPASSQPVQRNAPSRKHHQLPKRHKSMPLIQTSVAAQAAAAAKAAASVLSARMAGMAGMAPSSAGIGRVATPESGGFPAGIETPPLPPPPQQQQQQSTVAARHAPASNTYAVQAGNATFSLTNDFAAVAGNAVAAAFEQEAASRRWDVAEGAEGQLESSASPAAAQHYARVPVTTGAAPC